MPPPPPFYWYIDVWPLWAGLCLIFLLQCFCIFFLGCTLTSGWPCRRQVKPVEESHEPPVVQTIECMLGCLAKSQPEVVQQAVWALNRRHDLIPAKMPVERLPLARLIARSLEKHQLYVEVDLLGTVRDVAAGPASAISRKVHECANALQVPAEYGVSAQPLQAEPEAHARPEDETGAAPVFGRALSRDDAVDSDALTRLTVTVTSDQDSLDRLMGYRRRDSNPGRSARP